MLRLIWWAKLHFHPSQNGGGDIYCVVGNILKSLSMHVGWWMRNNTIEMAFFNPMYNKV
jgi:hypothetical protein